jgi:prenyltransferase beta subunit
LFVRKTDFYHTCYALSGLSVAQHGTTSQHLNCRVPSDDNNNNNNNNNSDLNEPDPVVVGRRANRLPRVDLLHGVRVERVDAALAYFAKHPLNK